MSWTTSALRVRGPGSAMEGRRPGWSAWWSAPVGRPHDGAQRRAGAGDLTRAGGRHHDTASRDRSRPSVQPERPRGQTSDEDERRQTSHRPGCRRSCGCLHRHGQPRPAGARQRGAGHAPAGRGGRPRPQLPTLGRGALAAAARHAHHRPHRHGHREPLLPAGRERRRGCRPRARLLRPAGGRPPRSGARDRVARGARRA